MSDSLPSTADLLAHADNVTNAGNLVEEDQRLKDELYAAACALRALSASREAPSVEAVTPMSNADWLRAITAWLDMSDMRASVLQHIEDAADELDDHARLSAGQGAQEPFGYFVANVFEFFRKRETAEWAQAVVGGEIVPLYAAPPHTPEKVSSRLYAKGPEWQHELDSLSHGTHKDHSGDVTEKVAPQDEGWRPIETAPKDGTTILLAHSKAAFDGSWSSGEDGSLVGWVDGCVDGYGDLITYEPTHWMPLPSAPRDGGAS